MEKKNIYREEILKKNLWNVNDDCWYENYTCTDEYTGSPTFRLVLPVGMRVTHCYIPIT